MVMVRKDWPEICPVKKKKPDVVGNEKEKKSEEEVVELTSTEDDLFCIRLNSNVARGRKASSNEPLGRKGKGANAVWQVEERSDLRKIFRRKGPGSNLGHIGPKADVAGPSGWKNPNSEVITMKSTGLVDLIDKSLEGNIGDFVELDANPMAIIPYIGQVFNEVIDKLSVLGLKGEALEEIGPKKVKRRKTKGEGISQVPEISAYAASLQKTKAKMRKVNRKRPTSICKSQNEEEKRGDEMMGDASIEESNGDAFTFKAGRGRRKRCVNGEGIGGWLLTATRQP